MCFLGGVQVYWEGINYLFDIHNTEKCKKSGAYMKNNLRSSNLELLRIVAMMMVIILHYNGTNGALLTEGVPVINYQLSNIMQAISICSVNCFVLISGYFMIDKTEAPIKKCLLLLIDVAFWGLLGYGCAYVFWGETAGIKDIIFAVVPYIKGQRWFVRAYIILVLFAPFVNSCLVRLSKCNYWVLMILTLLLFSIWPSFFPNPPIDDYGFGFVHFVQLYILAGYVKLHMDWLPKRWMCAAGFVLSAVAIYVSSLVGWGYAHAYNYVFTITAALFLFLWFKSLNIRSATINRLAAGAFDVFVIHTTGFFAELIYIRLFHADKLLFEENGLYVVSLLLCAPVFYLFCTALSVGKRWVFRHTVNRWVEKLPIGSYRIE